MSLKNVDPFTIQRLGGVAESTGSADFYQRLASVLAELLRSQRWLVMRYSHYAAPEFLANSAMSEEAVQSYLNGLYRLDPLLRLVRSGTRSGVFVLNQLKVSQAKGTYFDRIFTMSLIYDEAAVLLSTPGNSSIAICVERSTRQFSRPSVTMLKMLFPLIRSLHLVHLNRIFLQPPPRARERTLDAIMIFDKHGRPVFRNERWMLLERQKKVPDMSGICGNDAIGARALSADLVLHWEMLEETFALAPSGRICTIEAHSPGYINADFQQTLSEFQSRYHLTPRERDILNLVLQGYPNAKVANKLALAPGTVRNHRHRLYFKLDITTERELFFLFIDHLLGRARSNLESIA